MNTFVNTIGETYDALVPPASLGLWAGSAPTTLQQPAPSKQANFSTVVGLTLMLGGIGLAYELPPTFADTARITAPSLHTVRNDYALFGYEISQSQHIAINQYLLEHITSRDFLQQIAIIIDDIYGSKTIRDLHVVEDVDTGELIMELTIKSGLPLNDEFDQKDQLLFQRIDASGLVWGLRNVVITQG
jgi:hypothetical protein